MPVKGIENSGGGSILHNAAAKQIITKLANKTNPSNK